MACNIINGILNGCADQVGGVKSIIIGDWSSDSVYALNSDNVITGVTSGSTYYTFEQVSEAAEFLTTGTHQNGQGGNGANFFTSQLNMTFRRKDAELRNTLLLMARGVLSVIVQDNNGTYWLLGYDSPVYVLESALNTGKLYGDASNTIGLEDVAREMPYEITSTAYSTLTIN